jgi:hypothetical protein
MEERKYNCAICNQLAFVVFYQQNPNNQKHQLVIQDAQGVETNYVELRDKAKQLEVMAEASTVEIFNEYLIEKTRKKEAWLSRGLSLFCQKCKKVYCAKHYNRVIFESETDYCCPQNHEKKIIE